MYKIALCAAVLALSSHVFALDTVLTSSPPIIQGSVRGMGGQVLAVDAAGNRYVAGEYDLTRDFNPGIGIDNKTNKGQTDAFVTRFNADGSYAWTQTFGGPDIDSGQAVVVSLDGTTVYVAGYFSISASLGNGGPSVTAGIFSNGFVLALDAATGLPKAGFGINGSGIQTIGGSSAEHAYGLAVNAATLFVVGDFGGTDLKIGGIAAGVTSSGSADSLILALDLATGTPKSGFGISGAGVQKFGGAGFDVAYAAVATGTNVWVTGQFQSGAAQIGAAGPTMASASIDGFVICLDATTGAASIGFANSGMQKFGGAGDDIARSVARSGANLYIAGEFASVDAKVGGAGATIPYVAGGTNAFVLALDATAGTPLPGFGAASTGVQTLAAPTNSVRGHGVTAAGQAVYLCGSFGGTMKIGGTGPGIPGVGSSDAFVSALDPASGAPLNTFGILNSGIQKFGGSLDDSCRGVAVFGATVYAAGRTASTDAGVNGIGKFAGDQGGGFLLPLNTATGALALSLVSPLTAAGAVGSPFTYTISASAPSTQFKAINLPPGLALDTGTGVISGTPTNFGTIKSAISAATALGTVSANLTITIINDNAWKNSPPIVSGIVESPTGQALVVDGAGNRYVIGTFSGTVDFNPGAGADAKCSAGDYDCFITRFNSDGSYAWTQTFGGDDDDEGQALALSPDGLVIYAAGYFKSRTATIGGKGAAVSAAEGTSRFYDAFVLALNASSGVPISGFGTGGIQVFGGTADDFGNALTVYNGSVYVAGTFSSVDARIGGTGPGIGPAGGSDSYVLRLSAGTGAANANFGMASSGIQRFGGTLDERGRAVLASGSTLYVSGSMKSTNAQIGGTGAVVSASIGCGFVMALNPDTGTALTTFGESSSAVQRFLFSSNTIGNCLAANASKLYIAGSTELTNGTGTGAFVLPLDPATGALGTARQFGGTGEDFGTGLALGASTLYLAGSFTGSSAGTGTGFTIGSSGVADAFVVAFDPATLTPKDGFGFHGMQKFGGYSNEYAYAAAVSGNSVLIAGYVHSDNAGVGGTGPFDGEEAGGFLLSLDAVTGVPNNPSITSDLQQAGSVGVPFSYAITATVPPIGYSVTALPPGLTLAAATGIISGVPSAAGTYQVPLTVQFPAAVASAVLTIVIPDDAIAKYHLPIITGTVQSPSGQGLAVDAAGNRYLTGTFQTSGDFNPGPGIDAKACSGDHDVFVTRFNADGSYAWTQTFGGFLDDQARAVTLSPNGQTVYVAGFFNSPDARVGAKGPAIGTQTPNTYDGFVLALDAATGAPRTNFGIGGSGVQRIGGTRDDQANGIAANSSALYVSGTFSSSDARIGLTGNTISTQIQYTNGFVAALDLATGAAKTAFGAAGSGMQTLSATATIEAYGIAASATRVYCTGNFNTIKLTIGNAAVGVPSSFIDAFIVSLDAATGLGDAGFGRAGTGIQTFGGNNHDYGQGLLLGGNTLFVAGRFRSPNAQIAAAGPQVASAVTGTDDGFVLALSASTGTALPGFGIASSGVATFGGAQDDAAYGLALNGSTLFVSGEFESSDAKLNGAGSPYASLGRLDAFVLALDAATGVGKPNFGPSGGVRRFCGDQDETGAGLAFANGRLFLAGATLSPNGAVDALGNNNGVGFGGYLLPLDPASGAVFSPRIVSATAVAAGVNLPFSYSIVVQGGTVSTYSALNLPAELSLNSASGVISGTFAAQGSHLVPLLAMTENGPASASLIITVIGDAVAATHPPVIQGVVPVSTAQPLVMDAAGNSFVAGSFSGTLDFNAGQGNDPKSSAGGIDGFVTRHNADGSYAWTQTFGGTANDYCYSLALSPDGTTVYVTGPFSSADARIGGALQTISAAGSSDAFVLALDAATGAPRTNFGLNASGIQRIGGTEADAGWCIAVDANAVYAGGSFRSVALSVGANVASVATSGWEDAYICALNPLTGAALTGFGLAGSGIQKFGGTSTEFAFGLALQGNTLYASGNFNSTTAQIGGAGPLIPTQGSDDAFVLALDAATGQPRSAFGMASSGIQTFGGSSFDYGCGLAATPSAIYLTGTVNSTSAKVGAAGAPAAHIGNTRNLYVLALDPVSGAPITSFGAGGTGVQVFGGSSSVGGFSVAVSGTKVYVASEVLGDGSYYPGAVDTLNDIGGYDALILCMDAATGAPAAAFNGGKGAQIFGGSDRDSAFGLAVNASKLLVSGRLDSTNAGLGAAGKISGVGFNGYLLTLDPNTGQGVDGGPLDIQLASVILPENSAVGTAAGTLTTDGSIPLDAVAYSLVPGAGSNDNAAFSISGSTLNTASVFDFEAKNSYTIRIRSTNSLGSYFEKSFSIVVSDVNEPPSGLSVASTLPENSPAGSVLGTFTSTDPDALDTFSYALVSGAGDQDNALFAIAGNKLQSAVVFDYETRSAFSIRVRTTDSGGLAFEKVISIGITNVNEAPIALSLSSAALEENSPVGTLVGTFSTSDPDQGGVFTYQLADGIGGADNGFFSVSGNALLAKTSLNFEERDKYNIRVRSTDAGGLSIEQDFVVFVVNVNEAPAALDISNAAIAEKLPAGSAVGTLSTQDPDANDTFTYELGDTNNTSFAIAGNLLLTATVLDEAAPDNLAVRIRATDSGGLFIEREFAIKIIRASPQFISAPGATPNPAQIDEQISFSAGAVSPASALITWTFDDGVILSGAFVTHAFATGGLHVVTVSASTATATVQETLSVNVIAPLTFDLPKGRLKFDFKKYHDSLSMSGTMALPGGFTPQGKTVSITIGTLAKQFVLNAKGKGGDKNNQLIVANAAKKNQMPYSLAKITLNLKSQNLFDSLATFGFRNATVSPAERIPIVVTLVIDGSTYAAKPVFLYSAKLSASGRGNVTKSTIR